MKLSKNYIYGASKVLNERICIRQDAPVEMDIWMPKLQICMLKEVYRSINNREAIKC